MRDRLSAGLLGFAVLAAGIALAVVAPFAAGSWAASAYSCSGQIVKIFDNTNANAVVNGGTPPSFTTNGAYCLTSIGTYHWNSGHGQSPGQLSLSRTSGPAGFPSSVGPFDAQGSAGQGGAPNVNWQANVPTTPTPTVIDGTYTCQDSTPSTWSANTVGGPGFCIVYGIAAQSTSTTTPTTATTTPRPVAKAKVSEKWNNKGLELVIDNTGQVTLRYVRFRPRAGWKVSTLSRGKCKAASGGVVCDQNVLVPPGQAIKFTITDFSGKPNGGQLWVNSTPQATGATGPLKVSAPPEQTASQRLQLSYLRLDFHISDLIDELNHGSLSTREIRIRINSYLAPEQADILRDDFTFPEAWNGCDLRRILADAVFADMYFDTAREEVSTNAPLREEQLETNGAAASFDGISSEAKKCGRMPHDVQAGFTALTRDATALATGLHNGKVGDSELIVQIGGLERRKHNLLGRLPQASGVSFDFVVRETVKVLDLMHKAGTAARPQDFLEQAVKHKDAVYNAVKKAAR